MRFPVKRSIIIPFFLSFFLFESQATIKLYVPGTDQSTPEEQLPKVVKKSRRQLMIERRQQKKVKRLEKLFGIAKDSYAETFKAYQKVQETKPAEYAYHVSKLKDTIIQEVEQGAFSNYVPSRWWNRLANGLAITGEVLNAVAGGSNSPRDALNHYQLRQNVTAMNERQAVRDCKPLINFLDVILPKTISQLSGGLKNVQESALTRRAKALLKKLEGIKRVFA